MFGDRFERSVGGGLPLECGDVWGEYSTMIERWFAIGDRYSDVLLRLRALGGQRDGRFDSSRG